MERILVAVDDSRASLAAARLAVDLAAQLGASLRLVHVVEDSDLAAALGSSAGPDLSERRGVAVESLFRHLTRIARAAGVEAEPVVLYGQPAGHILEQARHWPAGLIVMGRRLERGVGGPYVGRETRMVLEFADQPVLVVPSDRTGQ